MGVQARVSELGGAKHAWGANFNAFAAHFVVYWASGLTYPIVLCGRSESLGTLPMCQIWSGRSTLPRDTGV